MPGSVHRFQWTEANCYHVLNRCQDRETTFTIMPTVGCLPFLELVARYRDRFGCHLYHYWARTRRRPRGIRWRFSEFTSPAPLG